MVVEKLQRFGTKHTMHNLEAVNDNVTVRGGATTAKGILLASSVCWLHFTEVVLVTSSHCFAFVLPLSLSLSNTKHILLLLLIATSYGEMQLPPEISLLIFLARNLNPQTNGGSSVGW